MKTNTVRFISAAFAALAIAWSPGAPAHCDTLDGPVVSDARKALDAGNVNLVLGWVRKQDEPEIRTAFRKASAVRKTGGQAKDLADGYFFETVVRVHRASEGAPYSGLKPAGTIEKPVAAADRALQTGKLEGVAKLVTERTHEGLEREFRNVVAKKNYKADDVAAARAYVAAYVEYAHYVERLYDAAGTPAHAASHTKAPAHAH